MFNFGVPSNPSSPTHSVGWSTRDSSMGRESSMTGTSRASPTASVLSSATGTSAATTGVKTRQIRDLKLEIEMRDQRIDELEEMYEETQRKAAFANGELQCKLDEQTLTVSAMAADQEKLKSTIDAQEAQMREMRDAMKQYQDMATHFKDMMARCAQLEQTQREAEERARAAEEARIAEERAREEEARAAAEAAKKAEEEAAAKKAEAEAAAREAAE
eukprot:CAMPEP_0174852472 /NCGR_PEP_ID=MMETSP1114-20130205/25549_1 /TAXON_ID=312471 /ORGANISM="Neobodo designis, Strain CCAP 1951/1" /LENGTH=216 /DNA_ID=CAMNT_0016087069 /DNA_START=59 /DNA_END=706 /DNA_ORIENTATION=+